jgi:ribosomal protein S18 acetylase RimI-like enzyme
MNYRLATKKDLPQIINFFKLIDVDFIPPLSKRFDVEREIKSLFEHSEKFLLLEKKKRIIGLVSFSENWGGGPDTYISFLIVHPSYRGKFIGRNLLAKCFNILIGDKVPKVVTRTWATNKKALELYEKEGFGIKKTLQDDREKGLNTIFLEKPLEGIHIIKKGKYEDSPEDR